jgi:hypothetical protein
MIQAGISDGEPVDPLAESVLRTERYNLATALRLGAYRQTNVIPFDKGAPHGAFTHFLKDAGQGDVPDIPRTGKALVPGCGRVSYRRTYVSKPD